MDKKRLKELAISVFVALIFISSYIAFGSNSPTGSSTTTSTVPQTVFAIGYANATITGFSQVMSISATCGNATNLTGSVNNLLGKLESNNSVSNFYSPSDTQIVVQAGNFNSLHIYNYINGNINANQSRCLSFSSGELLQLPATIQMNVQGQKLSVFIPNSTRSYQLPVTFTNFTAAKILVKIGALLMINGSVYGNLSVTKV